MAMNRYHGNSGRVESLPERSEISRQELFYRPREAQPSISARPPGLKREESRGGRGSESGLGSLFQDKLGGLFSKLTELETEDLILLLILYLLYRESGDEQYLIILGLMLFL